MVCACVVVYVNVYGTVCVFSYVSVYLYHSLNMLLLSSAGQAQHCVTTSIAVLELAVWENSFPFIINFLWWSCPSPLEITLSRLGV